MNGSRRATSWLKSGFFPLALLTMMFGLMPTADANRYSLWLVADDLSNQMHFALPGADGGDSGDEGASDGSGDSGDSGDSGSSEGEGNNGHGNNADGMDSSNPGSKDGEDASGDLDDEVKNGKKRGKKIK